MKIIGTGLRRINTEAQERTQCEILEIGQYRLSDNKLEYEVVWNGYPTTYEEIQNLQGCKEHIKQIFTQRKTKIIRKRRSAFPFHRKKYFSQSQYNQCKYNPDDDIELQSQQELCEKQAEKQVSFLSKSSPSQEGEIKIQYRHFNHQFSNLKCQSVLQGSFEVKQVPFSKSYDDSEPQESSQIAKKNTQNITFYPSKASQNQSSAQCFAQDSQKSRNSNQVSIKINKSTTFNIVKQNQIHIKPHSDITKKKQTVERINAPQKLIIPLKKQTQNLKIQKKVIEINIEPQKKQEVFVTKSIRNGKKVTFEIMVYNEEGNLVPKIISHYELVKKAPYALLKYYERRIIS